MKNLLLLGGTVTYSSEEDVLTLSFSAKRSVFLAMFNAQCICSTKNFETLRKVTASFCEKYNLVEED